MELDSFINTDSANFSDDLSSRSQMEDTILLTRFIAYNVVAPAIIVMGILGNGLTIFILKHPTFKGVMYNFYLALAVFDFLSLFTSISGINHLINPATSSYSLVLWYSYFEVLFINGFMGTSVLIVVCITFDRYMSVRHPHKFKIIHTNRFCIIGISISCLLSFLIWIPACFLKKPILVKDCDVFYYKNKTDQSLWVPCQVIDPAKVKWYNAYTWIREILISFLPIIVVIVFNTFLVKYFIDKHKRSSSFNSNSHRINTITVPHCRRVGDKSLSSLLQAIILCLLITLLPAGIFNAMYFEKLTRNLKYEIFRALANNLELLNHALNFYLYVLMSKPVRTALPFLLRNTKHNIMKKLGRNSTNDVPSSRAEQHIGRYTVKEEPYLENEDSKMSVHSQLSDISSGKQVAEVCPESDKEAKNHIPLSYPVSSKSST